jgi:hypothetical protein
MSRTLDWRAAYVATWYGRPTLVVVLLAAAALVAAIASFPSSHRSAGSYLNLAAYVLGFGLSRRIIAGDQQSGAWVLLFQRPTSPVRHYARVLALNLAAIVLIFAAGGLVASVAAIATGSSAAAPWPFVASGIVMATSLLAVGFGISALVGRLDAELLLVLFILTIQVVGALLFNLTGAVAHIVEWLFFPLNGLFMLEEWLIVGTSRLTTAYVAHVILYPIVWIALGFWWLRRHPFMAK